MYGNVETHKAFFNVKHNSNLFFRRKASHSRAGQGDTDILCGRRSQLCVRGRASRSPQKWSRYVSKRRIQASWEVGVLLFLSSCHIESSASPFCALSTGILSTLRHARKPAGDHRHRLFAGRHQARILTAWHFSGGARGPKHAHNQDSQILERERLQYCVYWAPNEIKKSSQQRFARFRWLIGLFGVLLRLSRNSALVSHLKFSPQMANGWWTRYGQRNGGSWHSNNRRQHDVRKYTEPRAQNRLWLCSKCGTHNWETQGTQRMKQIQEHFTCRQTTKKSDDISCMGSEDAQRTDTDVFCMDSRHAKKDTLGRGNRASKQLASGMKVHRFIP